MKRLLQINPFISLFSLVLLFMTTINTLAIDSNKDVKGKILAVPTFTSVPAAGAAGVNQSADIVLTFSEPIRWITGNTTLDDSNIDGRITLKYGGSGGADISFDATINAGKTIVTINPTGNLNSLAVIYVAIQDVEAISDDADLDPNPTSFTFTVGDFTPPVASFSPPSGALNVPISSNLIISFDENIRQSDGSPLDAAAIEAGIVELKVTNDAGAAVPFTATFNGTNQITIDPVANLLNNTTYYLEVNPIEDNSGNETAQSTITFQTPDTIAPTVTFTPTDGSTGVLETTTIIIDFNEAVRALDDSPLTPLNLPSRIKLKLTDNTGMDVDFTASINVAETQIIITPTAVLAGNTQYYVEIAQVEDYSQNAIPTSSITFTTGDTLPPTILFNPTGGFVNFSAVGNIIITFNEPIRNIDDSPITPANIEAGLIEFKETNNGGTPVLFTATINGTNTVITLNPNTTLLRNQVYYVEVNPVEDVLDHATTAQNITFTTEDRPNISSFSPGSGTCIGDNVTINGARFTGTGNPISGNAQPTVRVNGVAIPPANIVSFNPTQIVFTLPVGSTTGPITVRNNDSDLVSGNSATDLNVFAAIDTSLPVTPATLNPAQNTNVDFVVGSTQGSNYNYDLILTAAPAGYSLAPPASVHTLAGNSGTRTLNTSEGPDPNLTHVGSYTYRIDVSRTGCVTRTLTNTPIMLTVASLAVSVNATKTSVCNGAATTLIGATSGGTGFYQFRWTSSPVGFNNSGSSPTVNPTVNTTYYLEVEDDAGNIVNGSISITVNPNPIADIVPAPLQTAVVKNYTVENRFYQLYGSPAGGVFSGNGVSLQGDGNYYFNPQSATAGSHPILYTFTNGNGCAGQDTETFVVTPSAINGLNVSYCESIKIDPTPGDPTPLSPITESVSPSYGAILRGGYQFTRLVLYRYNQTDGTTCISESAPVFGFCNFANNPLTVNSTQPVLDIQTGSPFQQPVSYTLNLDILRSQYGSSKDNAFYILAYGKSLLQPETYITFQPFQVLLNQASPSIVGINENENVCSDFSPSPITLSSSETTYTVTGFSLAPGAFSSTLSGTNNRDFYPGHASLLGKDERLLAITMNYNDGNNCPSSVIRKFNWVKKPDAPIALDVQYCQVASPSTFTITGEPSGSSDKPIWYEENIPTIIDSINWELKVPGVSGTAPDIKRFQVQQQYKGCRGNTTTVAIEIKPAPDANFTPPSICDGRDFTLTGPLAAGNTPYSTYDWSFGNSNTVSVASDNLITYNYGPNTGGTPYTIGLKVTNSVGCENTSTRPITVGINPKYDLGYKFICDGDNTEFKAIITGNVTATEFEWDFGDGTILPRGLAATNQNPIHSFATSGEYNVTVTSYTAQGCFNPTVKNVTILDYLTYSSSNPYSMAALDGGKGFWKLEDVNGNSTWEFAQGTTPLKGLLTTPAWVTNATGDYNSNEKSFLNSPCLNIAAIERPVISMDMVLNTQENFDGAVLEYSVDNGITWQPAGNVDSGINWFNTSGFFAGNIGNSPVGWSGDSKDLLDNPSNNKLVQVRRALDNLNQLNAGTMQKVRFRIAFQSNPDREAEGMGFNNVIIDSRDRISLAENFTNPGGTQSSGNNISFNSLLGAEIAKIEYHVGFPTADPIFAANEADPSARAAFYGISKDDVSRGYIDGASGGRFNQAWAQNRLNKQSLKSSPYTLSVDTQVPASPDYLKIAVSIKADENIPANGKPVIQIAVVEKTVSSNEFVLRKLVPSAAGTPLIVPMAKDATVDIVESIRIENASDITNLALVVFIQDEVTREVYQAAFNLTPTNLPTVNVVTGIEHIAEFIQLYPNPASNSFVIELPTKTDSRLSVHMVDQVGRIVHESAIEMGEQSKTINTQDLAGGIYIVQIGAGKSGVVRKKMMIVHKN
jgi:hypothetical protein